jgi:hypothetical protein
MWTADFTPDLSAVGRPGGGGGGDVIVAVVGAGMMTGAGDEPIRFDADRGAATGGGSGGIAARGREWGGARVRHGGGEETASVRPVDGSSSRGSWMLWVLRARWVKWVYPLWPA